MRTHLAAAAAILLVLAPLSTLEAQDPPDLSGSWTLSSTEGGTEGPRGQMGQRGQMAQRGGMGMMAGLGPQVTLVHEANMLTVVRTTRAGELRQAYRLDGSESRNQLSMGDQQMEVVSHAEWEEDALVIVTQLPMGGGQAETEMRLTLDAAGVLVVETRRSGGMGGQGGGVVTTRYTKEG